MIKSCSLAAALALSTSVVHAEPTHVMIRAQAVDAKFIGDQMGGVQVALKDARTGAVLAKGLIKGGTGDTTRIMKTPRARGADIADAATAGFDAVLDLDRPTLVLAEATGPMGKPAAAIKVTSTRWIVPGHDQKGDGWVLSFPGLVIEPTTKPLPDGGLQVSAKVSLMCGCPIEPGGIWDANTYSVEAQLLKGQQVVSRTALSYAGQPSQFAGVLSPSPAGRYTLRLVAIDQRTPNTGVSESGVRLR